MKHIKKCLALVLTLAMVMAMGITAFADDAPTKGSITIENAAKGEKYGVVKLFDAQLGAEGAISYTGDIPDELADYFTKDGTGHILKATGKTDDEIAAAVQKWAASQTFEETTATGQALVFDNLEFGYYVIKSSQGSTISVDSTTPNAVVYDKNTKTITAKKEVEKESYSIGDTIKYTATFDTVNFYGEGKNTKQVINYTITDTLPDFMSDAKITKITITKADGTTEDTTFDDKNFDSEGKVVLDWATEVEGSSDPKKWTSKYDNGAKIIVAYEAKLTSDTNINADDTNTVKIQPQTVKDDGTPDEEKPWDDNWQKDATIKTYAAALKKVDENKKALDGAEFTIKGLVVEKTEAGVYTVVSYSPTSDAQSEPLKTDSDGKLYIVGLASDVELTVTETKAPDGYNKLDEAIQLKPQKIGEKIIKESGTINYDAKGNVIGSSSQKTVAETKNETANLEKLDAAALEVINNKGTELPSTGGIGTTIFYVLGGILVVGAGVVLITRKRMGAQK